MSIKCNKLRKETSINSIELKPQRGNGLKISIPSAVIVVHKKENGE